MRGVLGKATAAEVRTAIGAINEPGVGVIAGDVSNANAWWVKLSGAVPLIIQGGYNETQVNHTRTVTYPIGYSGILGVLITEISYRADSDWGELTQKPNNTNFTYYQNGRSTGSFWYSIGI